MESAPGRPRRAVFLDRDGTVIEHVRYPRDPEHVRFVDGALDALRTLEVAGFALVLVSNQSGIGRGLIAPEEAVAVHERFVSGLAAGGVALDDVRYCPHTPEDRCACRKPEPGMLLDAAVELDIDLAGSFMVGDSVTDVEAGSRAGVRPIRFEGDWADVLDAILGAEVGA